MARVHLLRALRGAYGLTDTELARQLNIPRASVRRLIGDVRAFGINVRTVCGFYRLEE
jgi:biotin operon repressor